MSITAIPTLISAAAAPTNAAASQPAAPAPQTPAKIASDTVQLTEAERVYQLYNQGQQVPQIANTLSLTETAVNSYLNISNSAA
jgi:DNA-binding NarL/FixJ family response regulator